MNPLPLYRRDDVRFFLRHARYSQLNTGWLSLVVRSRRDA